MPAIGSGERLLTWSCLPPGGFDAAEEPHAGAEAQQVAVERPGVRCRVVTIAVDRDDPSWPGYGRVTGRNLDDTRTCLNGAWTVRRAGPWRTTVEFVSVQCLAAQIVGYTLGSRHRATLTVSEIVSSNDGQRHIREQSLTCGRACWLSWPFQSSWRPVRRGQQAMQTVSPLRTSTSGKPSPVPSVVEASRSPAAVSPSPTVGSVPLAAPTVPAPASPVVPSPSPSPVTVVSPVAVAASPSSSRSVRISAFDSILRTSRSRCKTSEARPLT